MTFQIADDSWYPKSLTTQTIVVIHPIWVSIISFDSVLSFSVWWRSLYSLVPTAVVGLLARLVLNATSLTPRCLNDRFMCDGHFLLQLNNTDIPVFLFYFPNTVMNVGFFICPKISYVYIRVDIIRSITCKLGSITYTCTLLSSQSDFQFMSNLCSELWVKKNGFLHVLIWETNECQYPSG